MKILFATDGSEFSEGAAKFLTRLNFSSDDEIVVLYAISRTPILSEWEFLYPDFKEIRNEIAPKIFNSAKDILKLGNAKISSLLIDGYPGKVIVDTAEDTGADIIVMGASGLRGIESYIVGSVTRSVAVKSSKPVLIIRPPQGEISETMKVLFASDGSIHSDVTAKFLSSIPFPDNTELTILNVITTIFEDIPERFAMEINGRIKEIVAATREKEFEESKKIIEKTREYLSNRFSKIEELTKTGNSAGEILKTAETLNADIIAVGSSGMRGIKGMLGSESRYILNHSRCSVLVGKS